MLCLEISSNKQAVRNLEMILDQGYGTSLTKMALHLSRSPQNQRKFHQGAAADLPLLMKGDKSLLPCLTELFNSRLGEPENAGIDIHQQSD
jgi:hypothetical protein